MLSQPQIYCIAQTNPNSLSTGLLQYRLQKQSKPKSEYEFTVITKQVSRYSKSSRFVWE